MLFSVLVLYPLLPQLVYGKQQQQRQDLFPFSYPTTTTLSTTTTPTSKSETNNYVQSESVSPHTHDKKVQNDNADVSYNDNVDTNDNGDDNAADVQNSDNNNVDVNNPSSYSSSSSSTDNNTPKAVILNFYDNDIGQFTNAKPILDKYGFKGSFFIVCSWASSDNNPDRMNWQQITQLYNEGHDINSHSTSHKVLSKLSADDLDYQVGQSKECFRVSDLILRLAF